MLAQKPLSLWISVGLFAVAVTLIPLAVQRQCGSVSSPRTLAELAARLSQGTPPLHVVPQFPDRLEDTFWVSTTLHSREQLWGLGRQPELAKKGQWQGIVMCESRGKGSVILDEFIEENWGEYGMRVGPFVLFGDPDLLQVIRKMIVES